MGENDTRVNALFALFAGITGVAGSFAVTGYSRQFVVAPIDAVVVRLTPGPLVAWSIETLGDAGHLLHISLSLFIAVGILAGTARIGLLVRARLDRPIGGAVTSGGLAWLVTAIVTAAPLLAFGAAIPVGVVTGVAVAPAATGDHDASRRRVILTGASSITFGLLALGIGRIRSGGDPAVAEPDAEIPEAVETRLQLADDRSLEMASDDLPGLVSTIDSFYTVDIAQFDPTIRDTDWSLSVTGEVGEDVGIGYTELTDMPTEHRFLTLRCVGEALNGHKMDTAVWTGTPIGPLLDAADPAGACNCAMVHAEDGYSVQIPVAALEDALLAWGMNGQSLPRAHGHPVRLLVPGHWGETNVKWLTEIELLEDELDGYWEQRGWRGTGPVNTVAKLWANTTLEDGQIEVAGHAYAGTRGIDRVEVSTDGGTTWTDAELSAPLPGTDVWRQWRFVFEPDGPSDIVVRATDGEGTLQPKADAQPFPSGATGWVKKTIRP